MTDNDANEYWREFWEDGNGYGTLICHDGSWYECVSHFGRSRYISRPPNADWREREDIPYTEVYLNRSKTTPPKNLEKTLTVVLSDFIPISDLLAIIIKYCLINCPPSLSFDVLRNVSYLPLIGQSSVPMRLSQDDPDHITFSLSKDIMYKNISMACILMRTTEPFHQQFASRIRLGCPNYRWSCRGHVGNSMIDLTKTREMNENIIDKTKSFCFRYNMSHFLLHGRFHMNSRNVPIVPRLKLTIADHHALYSN